MAILTILILPTQEHGISFNLTSFINVLDFSVYKSCVSLKLKVTQSCLTLCDPHGLYSLWNSPGENTGEDSHSLLQQIFLTHESNQGLLNCRQIIHQLSYQGSPLLPWWDLFWCILVYSWEFYMCTWEECMFYCIWMECCYSKYVPQNKTCQINFTQQTFWFFFFTISVPTRTWWNLICIRNTILHDSYTQWSWGNTNLEQVFSPSPVEKWGCIITCIEYCRCVAVLLQILTNILRAKLSPVENQWLSWNMEVSWQNSDQSPFLPQFEPFNKSFNCFRCIYFCSGK